MKPLVLYHANCLDGYAAAFAAWTVLGDEAEYLPVKYGEEFDTDVSHREVYILDFSFPRLTMERLFSTAKRVVWLDHHKSAFEMWCDEERTYTMHDDPYHTIILDNNKSGALIAWEYFHPGEEVPTFIKHVDDYDRWQFKIIGTKTFNKALWSRAPWSFAQWIDMFYDCEEKFNHKYWADLYTEGEAILRAHDQNVQTVVKGTAMKCEIPMMHSPDFWEASLHGLMSNCPAHLTSDVGHELANQSGTFGLLWSIRKDGKCGCSLRSNGDCDVSAIAKAFGGGGHRNAAGFEVPIATLLSWMKP